MWTCAQCKETHEDNFDACWNCGAARDPSDVVAPSPGEPPSSIAVLTTADRQSLEDQFRDRFECEQCGARRCRIKRVAMTGTGLSRVLDVQGNRYLSVSCESCGRAQLFDLDVLEGADKLADVLDLIFTR